MRSGLEGGAAIAPDATADAMGRAFGTPIREAIARPRRPVPDDGRAAAPDPVAPARPRPRSAGARFVRPPYEQPWPRSAVVAFQTVAFGAFLCAVIYGPPYLECRRLKSTGHFFSGMTVRACFDEKFAAQNESAEALVRRARDALRGGGRATADASAARA